MKERRRVAAANVRGYSARCIFLASRRKLLLETFFLAVCSSGEGKEERGESAGFPREGAAVFVFSRGHALLRFLHPGDFCAAADSREAALRLDSVVRTRPGL